MPALQTPAVLAKVGTDLAYGPRKTFGAVSTAATATLAPRAFDQVDATAGSAVRKLSAGTTNDDQVVVKVYAISGTNTVTIQGDTGVTCPTITLTAVNQAVTFSWTGSAWVVSGRDNPPSYLTASFAPRSVIPAGRYASSVWMGDANGGQTQTQLQAQLTQLQLLGKRPVVLHFHIAFDSSNTLKIVQFGFNSTNHSEATIDWFVGQLIANGFTIAGIKVGNPGTPSGGFSSSFWTAYNNLISYLATKYQGVTQWFFITNEYIQATSDPAQTSALQNVISTVQGKGYKASMSFVGLNEAATCTVLSNLDGFGVNTYPLVGTKGALTPVQDVQDAFVRTGVIDWFRSMKQQYPTKPCFITETGTTDKTTSLEYTAAYSFPGMPDQNGAVYSAYWSAILPLIAGYMAEPTPPIDSLFAWDNGIFNPSQYPASLAVMKKYVGVTA